MPTIADIRQQAGGAYDDMSDEQLAAAIHRKFYSDMPEETFRIKVGLTGTPRADTPAGTVPADRISGAFEDAAAQPVETRLSKNYPGINGYNSSDYARSQMPFSDELAGVLGGIKSAVGESSSAGPALSNFKQGYAQTRALSKRYAEEYAADHPRAALITSVLSLAAGKPGANVGLSQAIKGGVPLSAAIGFSEGDTLAERGTNAGVGAGLATALPVVGTAVGRLGSAAYNSVAAPLRAWRNPEAEAARRIAVAQTADTSPLTQADELAAAANAQPVMNLDRGGESTRALARASANVSPVARSTLETAVQERSANKGSRTVEMVRRIAGTATTAERRDQIHNAAALANKPAYDRAYSAPAAQSVWDEGLEQLASAPVVQDAIRQASVTGRNKAALGGFAPMRNPFQIDPQTRQLTLKVNQDGNRSVPSLQFWDHVKRNLDAVGTREARQAARVLRDHLDDLVPEYRAARSGAAKFFGAGDALEAGEVFVSSRMDNAAARKALAKMSGPERKLFAEGFADTLVRRVQEADNRPGVINSAFLRSSASRERIELALGSERAKELEVFLRVEDILDRSKSAVTGNSTTARQLVELGIAGGAGAYSYATDDWTVGATAIAGVLARRGLARGTAAVDKKVADKVAEMLVSDKPEVVRLGLKMVANNRAMMDALRSLAPGAAMAATPSGGAL